ncbi:hypothetical protein QR680_004451 [Steinernema hermaphroditum]|uniref:VWFA domain-containing protein n=1 Tax=Steinernema hermaphroditum TaxID=289476 RepID=A0AA39LT71_9BILA|nr:hypothetical protein QR680_004451 [Steinernema hermaphroditum]
MALLVVSYCPTGQDYVCVLSIVRCRTPNNFDDNYHNHDYNDHDHNHHTYVPYPCKPQAYDILFGIATRKDEYNDVRDQIDSFIRHFDIGDGPGQARFASILNTVSRPTLKFPTSKTHNAFIASLSRSFNRDEDYNWMNHELLKLGRPLFDSKRTDSTVHVKKVVIIFGGDNKSAVGDNISEGVKTKQDNIQTYVISYGLSNELGRIYHLTPNRPDRMFHVETVKQSQSKLDKIREDIVSDDLCDL